MLNCCGIDNRLFSISDFLAEFGVNFNTGDCWVKAALSNLSLEDKFADIENVVDSISPHLVQHDDTNSVSYDTL